MSESPQDRISKEIAEQQARLSELEAERAAVAKRLARMQGELREAERSSGHLPVVPAPGTQRSRQEKVALFRSLFTGRRDVFPKLWRNRRTKKQGYAPACANEWVEGICEKPRVKCGECPSQAFLDVTDQVMLDHLQGRHVIGAYPLLEDDHCWFLAVDFDKKDWQEDVSAYATTVRRFGPILTFQLGPVRHAVDPRRQAAGRPFEHLLTVRETSFHLDAPEGVPGIQEIYGRLASDEARNTLILDDVIRALEDGRSPIVLTERRDHLDFLVERLERVARNLVVLRGGLGEKRRRATMEKLAAVPATEERLVLATGRFIGEGFDDSRLDTLFLTMPVAWKGTLVQYAGRLHRARQGKTAVRIYDYVDRDVPMLARMFKKRLKGYRGMGYQIAEAPTEDVRDLTIEYDEEVM